MFAVPWAWPFTGPEPQTHSKTPAVSTTNDRRHPMVPGKLLHTTTPVTAPAR